MKKLIIFGSSCVMGVSCYGAGLVSGTLSAMGTGGSSSGSSGTNGSFVPTTFVLSQFYTNTSGSVQYIKQEVKLQHNSAAALGGFYLFVDQSGGHNWTTNSDATGSNGVNDVTLMLYGCVSNGGAYCITNFPAAGVVGFVDSLIPNTGFVMTQGSSGSGVGGSATNVSNGSFSNVTLTGTSTIPNATTTSNLFGGTIYNASTYPTNIYFGTGTIFGTNGLTNVTSTTAGAFHDVLFGWDLIVSNCQMKVVGKQSDSNITVMTLSGGITGIGFALGATVWQIYPNAINTKDVNGMPVGGIGNEGGTTYAGYSNGVVQNNGNMTWAGGAQNSWIEYVGSDGIHNLKSIRGATFPLDPQAGAVFDFSPQAPSFIATNSMIFFRNGNPGSQLNLFFDNLLGDGVALEAQSGGNAVNFRVATLLGNGVSVGTVGVNANYQVFTPSFSDYSGFTYSTAFGLVFTNQNGNPTPIVVGKVSTTVGISSTATNTLLVVATSGVTNNQGVNFRLMGLTGTSVVQTNQATSIGFSRGTITTPTDIILQSNEFIRGTSVAVQGQQAF